MPLKVYVREGETVQQALGRFRKLLERNRPWTRFYKRPRTYYEKPSILRRTAEWWRTTRARMHSRIGEGRARSGRPLDRRGLLALPTNRLF